MAGAFQISPDELVDILSKLAQDNNLQVSVIHSVKGGVIAGTGEALGGLLAGPLGIAVGATVGVLVGTWSTGDTFTSVYSILQDMSQVEKKRLYRHLMSALGDASMLDITALAVLIATDQVYKRKVIGGMTDYFRKELQMEIVEWNL